MIESIYVGMTGLSSFSRGLRVIANNTTNLNTPGFKGSSLRFADAFYSNGSYSGHQFGQLGYGVSTTGTMMSFKPGELRQTGNGLDLAIDGQGLFTLRGEDGKITYTRAGQFQFNSDGILVNQGTGEKVMGVGTDGKLTEISIANRRTNAGKPTTAIKFTGNLSSTGTDQTINNVRVIDSAGGEHTLSLKFTNTNTTTFGNIVASYNAATGVLTLTSSGATATIAQWQAAMRVSRSKIRRAWSAASGIPANDSMASMCAR